MMMTPIVVVVDNNNYYWSFWSCNYYCNGVDVEFVVVASSSSFVAEGTEFVPCERGLFQQTSQLRERLRPSEADSIGKRRQLPGQPLCRRDDQGSEVRVAS